MGKNDTVIWKYQYRAYLKEILPVDVDNDGEEEVIFYGFSRGWSAGGGGEFHILEMDGEEICQKIFWGEKRYPTNTIPAFISADMDLDGIDEVVLGADGFWIMEYGDFIEEYEY